MRHIMIVLETLGTSANSVILSIGAVRFGASGLGEEFYAEISRRSCVAAGLVVDADTVERWSRQRHHRRTSNLGDLRPVLARFGAWVYEGAEERGRCVWGCGSDFANTILAEASRAVGLQPLPFYRNRCYRTLKSLCPDNKQPRTGTAHNALDAAKTQAAHAIRLCQNLGVPL